MLICSPCLTKTVDDAERIGSGAKIQRAMCEMCSTWTLTYDIPSEALVTAPQAIPVSTEPTLSTPREVKPHIQVALDLYQDVVASVEAAKDADPTGQLLAPLRDPTNILLRNIEMVVGQDTIPHLTRKV